MQRWASAAFILVLASCGSTSNSALPGDVGSGDLPVVVRVDAVADVLDVGTDADDSSPGDARIAEDDSDPVERPGEDTPWGIDASESDTNDGELPADVVHSEDVVHPDDVVQPDDGVEADVPVDDGDPGSGSDIAVLDGGDVPLADIPGDAPCELPDVPALDLPADSAFDVTADAPEASDPGADTTLPDVPGVDVPAVQLELRLMAANLTSGNYQSYDPGHGIRLMAGCRADVYMVQEFNYGGNTPDDYRALADVVCGTECSYSAGVGHIPNGVISRWPIVESGAWDDPTVPDRDLDWARIDLPGARDLVVVSVHLHTSPAADQVDAAQIVAARIAEHRAAEPGCCWYVVGGDFNGQSSVSDKGFGAWKGEPVFFVDGPHPVGEDGAPGTNASRSKQYDYVLLDTDLRAYQVPLVFDAMDGGQPLTYPDGLVFDTRDFDDSVLDRYFWPAMEGDSGAPSMQHMGVIKAVRIP